MKTELERDDRVKDLELIRRQSLNIEAPNARRSELSVEYERTEKPRDNSIDREL